MSAYHGEREGSGGPYAGFVLNESRVPVIRTEQVEGRPREIDVVLGAARVRMRALGPLEQTGLEAYVEAHTYSLAPLYAIVVNAETPYETAYVFAGPANTEHSWVLNALDEMAHRHVHYRVARIDRRYAPADSFLQQIVTQQGLQQLLTTIEHLDDPIVSNAAGHISLLNALLKQFLEGFVDVAEDNQYLGETSLDGVSGTAYYEAHAYLGTSEATDLNVPSGLYILVSFTLDDNHNGVSGAMSEHFTVLHWGPDRNGWTTAPFVGNCNLHGSQTSLLTLEAIRSLDNLGGIQPSLFDVIHGLAMRT